MRRFVIWGPFSLLVQGRRLLHGSSDKRSFPGSAQPGPHPGSFALRSGLRPLRNATLREQRAGLALLKGGGVYLPGSNASSSVLCFNEAQCGSPRLDNRLGKRSGV